MSISLILTNCLFCGIAALFLVPLLRCPNMLTYQKGIPVFIGIIVVFLKTLIPYEFTFTQTVASRHILLVVRKIWMFSIFKSITVGALLLFIWLLIVALLITILINKYWKMMRILSAVPETKNMEILQMLSELCRQKQIQKKPKVIQLDLYTSPFIVGVRNPIIVLPHCQMSRSEIKFVLRHELEHFANHHILMKICTEIVTVIYWWNPFIWLLRREAIRALEIQADINVIQELSNKEKFSYLETLVAIAKKIQQKQNHILALSFAFNDTMLEYRLNTALKFDCFRKNKRTNVFQALLLGLSAMIVLSSFLFTFESCGNGPKDKGAFTINHSSDYFVVREDGCYDLYIDGEPRGIVPSIPDGLSDLEIRRCEQF